MNEKSINIPEGFRCPAVKNLPADPELESATCEVFGQTSWFCPYAAFPCLEERRLSGDCPFAPAEIWRHFRNFRERIELEAMEGS